MNRFLQLGVNKKGRDFVIGDIHGKYDQLMFGLTLVDFDFEKDRLLAVGDLIDRGDQNMKCLDMIGEPWFYTVIGNHEEMMLNALSEPTLEVYGNRNRMMQHWVGNGGDWYYGIDQAEIDELKNIFCPLIKHELPVGIEFIAENGKRVGITHAGLPRGWTWGQVKEDLECTQGLGAKVIQECLWTRTKIQDNSFMFDVLGIDLLINGHTPSIKEVWRGNNVFIDLGICNGGKLRPINVLDLLAREEKNEHYAWKE